MDILQPAFSKYRRPFLDKNGNEKKAFLEFQSYNNKGQDLPSTRVCVIPWQAASVYQDFVGKVSGSGFCLSHAFES